MGERYTSVPALCALCICLLADVGSAAGQLPTYPAAKPGDHGYIAEDPQLTRLVGRPGPALALRLVDGGTIDVSAPLPPHMKQSWNLLGFSEESAGESE